MSVGEVWCSCFDCFVGFNCLIWLAGGLDLMGDCLLLRSPLDQYLYVDLA